VSLYANFGDIHLVCTLDGGDVIRNAFGCVLRALLMT